MYFLFPRFILILLKMPFSCSGVTGFCTKAVGKLTSPRQCSRNHSRVSISHCSNVSFPKSSPLGLLLETWLRTSICYKRNSHLSCVSSCVNCCFYLKTSGSVQFSDPMNLLYAILPVPRKTN